MTASPGHIRQTSHCRLSHSMAARAAAASVVMLGKSGSAFSRARTALDLRFRQRLVAARPDFRVTSRLAAANRRTRSSNGGSGNADTPTAEAWAAFHKRQMNACGDRRRNYTRGAFLFAAVLALAVLAWLPIIFVVSLAFGARPHA